VTYILILHLIGPAGTASYTAGHMVDRQGCIIAGAGMAAILEQANPGLTMQPECQPMGTAA
jgi:hypothetical protein